MTPPHEKLPSKSPASLGLKFIQESRRSIKHLNAKIKLHVKQSQIQINKRLSQLVLNFRFLSKTFPLPVRLFHSQGYIKRLKISLS